ncbi:MAG: PorV/PorQ family protein, partial [Odoribacteraceae bacterium]|nr:PorV/PorQ family protein [Odoribacteraceae bacterium]
MKRVILVLLPVILFPAMLRAQSGTALFLVLPVDARVAGSGGGGIALPADAFSIFRAPAALSLDASRDGAGITRAACLPALLPGGYLDAAAVAFRVSGRGGVAAGFRHRSYPRAEGRDGDAMPTGTMHPAEWAAEVAYAHRLPAGLGVSVTTRYARLYAARSRDVFSFDAGMCYREPFFSMPGGSWAIAFHAGNLAGRVSRDVFLPARATLGGAIALPAAGGTLSGCVDLAYTFFPARDAHL